MYVTWKCSLPLPARYIRNVRNILDIRSSQFSRGGTKLQSFLLVTISQHYTTHVLSRPHWICSRTISLTEEHYLWCQLPAGRGETNVISCGGVCCPHSGHYDTLCFSPVIPSCLNHVMGIWQCWREGENTLLWLLQGEELRDGENDDLCWQ